MSAAEEFEELYRRTRRDVLGYLLRRTAEPQDAADLLAEVYVVAWRRRADRPKGRDARLWLFGVARNVLAAHARQRVRAREAADGLRTLLRDRGGEVAQQCGNDPDPARDAAVRAALARLPDLDRELVSLTIYEGCSPAEAAECLGISAGAARVRLHRARSRLRDVLAPGSPPPLYAVGKFAHDRRETSA